MKSKVIRNDLHSSLNLVPKEGKEYIVHSFIGHWSFVEFTDLP